MHHATVDGVSGANLISHLTSIEPDSPPLALTEITPFGHEPDAGPSCSAAGSSPRSPGR